MLFEHIRRDVVVRRDALTELRKRVPDAAVGWLDHIEDSGLWSDLLRCCVRNGSDDDTDIKVLKWTLAWLDAANPGGAPGPAESGSGVGNKFVPGTSTSDTEDPDDPNRPKGRTP